MESTKFESMPIVEEVSVTERIGSFDGAGAEIGIAEIGLSACTKHCPSENPPENLVICILPRFHYIHLGQVLQYAIRHTSHAQ